MTVQQSSITAYNQGVRSGKIPSQRNRILDLLKQSGQPMSRRMISKVLNIEPGAVAGRVNALIEGDLVVALEEHAPCPHTGKRVQFVQIAWPQSQMEMGI